jgi:hypothetical protein
VVHPEAAGATARRGAVAEAGAAPDAGPAIPGPAVAPGDGPEGRKAARLRRRRQRVPAAGLLHPVGHHEPDQRVHHVLAVVPAGQRLDDGGLGAGHAVREQLHRGVRARLPI